MSEKKSKSNNKQSGKNQAELEAKIQELESAYQRARADYVNLENRIKANQDQFATLITATVLSKFIEILDNLERAAAHIEDQGVKMIIDQMNKLLDEERVTPVETEGKDFDPQIMECTDKIPGEKDKVVKEVRKGYWLAGKHLIRPAQVMVGDGSEAEKNKN